MNESLPDSYIRTHTSVRTVRPVFESESNTRFPRHPSFHHLTRYHNLNQTEDDATSVSLLTWVAKHASSTYVRR